MEPKRQRELTLAGVVVALVAVAYAAYETVGPGRAPSEATAPASNEQGRSERRGGRTEPAGQHAQVEAPQVHLGALDSNRPEPGDAARDIFRFKVKPPPPPPPPPRPAVGPQPPPAPPGPPPLAPIALKFIGIVDVPPPGKRVAVLSDGRGSPVYGHEGETVLGQFRIIRIGAESIEMSYLDGRGRQTIRLSGS
jgi:hypothetical protein